MIKLSVQEADKIVGDHLRIHSQNYVDFLAIAKKAAETAKKTCGSDVIFRIYSRADKQGDGELKSRHKIVKKFSESRQRDTKYRIESMADIAGFTVVLYYSDQLDLFFSAFIKELGDKIYCEPYVNKDGASTISRVHREKGYHATHFKLRSKTVRFRPLIIEMQVKTMLHDSWGAKMHDLVYKPSGVLDPKLRSLMESFGDSLQAIEVQSEALRDAINGRMMILEQRRRAALVRLMDRLTNEKFPTQLAGEKFEECFQQIEVDRENLATCSSDDVLMTETIERIAKLAENGVDAFTRLRLLIFVATLRDDTDLAVEIDSAFQEWVDQSAPDEYFRVFVEAASLHQTNRIEDSIELLRNFLETRKSDENSRTLRLNLASYILESNLIKLEMESRDEVEALLASVPLDNLSQAEISSHRNCVAASKIVFGDESELEEGLKLCNEASKDVVSYGAGYCELYLTYGWQRKLRV